MVASKGWTCNPSMKYLTLSCQKPTCPKIPTGGCPQLSQTGAIIPWSSSVSIRATGLWGPWQPSFATEGARFDLLPPFARYAERSVYTSSWDSCIRSFNIDSSCTLGPRVAAREKASRQAAELEAAPTEAVPTATDLVAAATAEAARHPKPEPESAEPIDVLHLQR